MGNLKYIISGSSILIMLILSGLTVNFVFTKDHSELYRDGELLAKHRWVVEAERTYINLNSWYRTNVMCPRIIEDGGYKTKTRCYYPEDYYETISRSLINTKLNFEDYIVNRITPYYKYGTRGAYAGKISEQFTFTETDKEEEFPQNYKLNWIPTDTRNYRLIWRVWDIKDMDLPDGEYKSCSYKFGNLKINLKDECSKLEKAEIEGDKIEFYFNPERAEQDFDLTFVDPTPIYTDNFTQVGNISGMGELYSVDYDGTYIYAGSWGDGLYVYTFDGIDFTLIDNLNLSSDAGYPKCRHIFDIDVDNTTIFLGGVYAVAAVKFNGTNLTLLDNYTTSGSIHGVSLIDWNETHDLMVSDHDTDGLRGYFWNGTKFSDLAFKYERGATERTYSSYAYNRTRIFSFDSSQGLLMYNISVGDENFTLVERDDTYYAYRGYYDSANEFLYTSPSTTEDTVGLAAWRVIEGGGVAYIANSKSIYNFSGGWPYADDKFVYSGTGSYNMLAIMEFSGLAFTSFQNISLSDDTMDFAGNQSDYLFVATLGDGLLAYEFNASAQELSNLNITFVSPTPSNGTNQSNDYVRINASISISTLILEEVIYNWNGTNFTHYDNDLVLMYNFDNVSALGENQTRAVDVSKMGGNGSIVGAIWDSGKYGGSFKFDGLDDYIAGSVNLNKSDNITMGIWMKLNEIDSSQYQGIMEYNQAALELYMQYTAGNNYITLRMRNETGSQSGVCRATTQPVVDTWYNLVGTYNGTYMALYVNGVLETTLAWCCGIQNGTGIEIGRRASSNYLNGSLDEVRIWNRSLSADEIYQQYISNLNKYDVDSWLLYTNQSKNTTIGLDNGTYTFQVFATDSSMTNQSDLRYIIIDTDYTGDDENTTPSDGAFNLVFEVPFNESYMIIYSLGFETNASGNPPAIGALSTSKTINSSIGGILAPNVITKYDTDNPTVKHYFGNVPHLPIVYERNYSMMFMLNVSDIAGELVSIPINITAKMESYSFNWTSFEGLNNQSLFLTAGTISGGILNNSLTNNYSIEFYVSDYT